MLHIPFVRWPRSSTKSMMSQLCSSYSSSSPLVLSSLVKDIGSKKYIYNTNNTNNTNNIKNILNLHLDNPSHHIFFDQMKVGSILSLSPHIHYYKNNIELNNKKICFNNVHYYDMILPKIKLDKSDIHQIQQKYKLLYNHSKFIPYTPFLGYNIINENMICEKKRNWYIWSYTDILQVDSKKEFMEKFYDLNYHKDPFIEKNILDFLLEHDYKNNKY